MNSLLLRNLCTGIGFVLPLMACAAPPPPRRPSAAPPPAFAEISPLFQRTCIPCHRADGCAPFSLESAAAAQAQARQIARVVREKIMPPWKAQATQKFQDCWALTPVETMQILHWTERDTTRSTQQQESEKLSVSVLSRRSPDALAEMPSPYLLPAETPETARSFVLSPAFKQARQLEALEFRWLNARDVRHATLWLDTTGEARRLQTPFASTGYFAFRSGLSHPQPLAFWSAGLSRTVWAKGAMPVIPASADLVLQVQFQPTGKPEKEQAQVALYFAEKPVSVVPVWGMLGQAALYLQPGKLALIEQEITLPVATRLRTLVPQLHAIGREVTVRGTLPTGRTETLLTTSDWDAAWTRPYVYRDPQELPAGTRLSVTVRLDNTANNPRNPARPPHHVLPGRDGVGEMAAVWFECVPANPADAAKLTQSFADAKPPHLTETGRYVK